MLHIMGNSLSAVRAYSRGLLVTAHNVANVQTKDFKPLDTVYLSRPTGGVTAEVRRSEEVGVDLAEETVNLISSQRAIQANIAVLRASDKTLGVLLDTVG